MTFLPLFDLTDTETPRTRLIPMLGLELKPTHVRAALVERGRVVRQQQQPLGDSKPDLVLDAIVRAAQALAATPKVAGLAIPGEVDGSGRCWGLPQLPGFDGVYIAEELAARLGCPVSIESEGQSATLAELLYGRGRGHASLLSVLFAERLSAGLVIDGELRRGRSGFGASIAHLRIDSAQTARTCSCGRQGCLAAYGSLQALALEHAAIAGGSASGADVCLLAAGGDVSALEAVARIAAALGKGLALVQNMLDLDAITVVAPAGVFQLLEPTLREAFRGSVFGEPAGEAPVLESLLGGDAVLIGAAELALRGVNENA
jgi:glucokinase